MTPPPTPVMATQPPKLSILIPAYAYAAGVSRILEGLAPWAADACEVLVFDDSPGVEVAAAVQAFVSRSGCAVGYRHHRPALGAVANWNALLDAARGEYVWLLHHDEFPVGPDFLARLMAALAGASAAPDALLLDCLLVNAANGRNRRHIPTALRLRVARQAPAYLLRRNLIGPVSALVMRRSLCPRFETALKWKVDVAFYERLLDQPGLRVQAAAGLAIGSVLNREGSITAGLQQGLLQRQHDEHRWLRERRNRPTLWLADPSNGSLPQRLAMAAEDLAWKLLRAAQRLPALLGVSALPPAVLLRALRHSSEATPARETGSPP
jgi:hypothetical protein